MVDPDQQPSSYPAPDRPPTPASAANSEEITPAALGFGYVAVFGIPLLGALWLINRFFVRSQGGWMLLAGIGLLLVFWILYSVGRTRAATYVAGIGIPLLLLAGPIYTGIDLHLREQTFIAAMHAQVTGSTLNSDAQVVAFGWEICDAIDAIAEMGTHARGDLEGAIIGYGMSGNDATVSARLANQLLCRDFSTFPQDRQ